MATDSTKLAPVSERPDVLDKPVFATAVHHRLPEILRSGISAAEAISRASSWWDRTGAKLARQQMKRGTNYDPATDDVVVKSGIVFGLPWDQLDKRERFQVIKAWAQIFEKQHLGKMVDDRLPDPIIVKQKAKSAAIKQRRGN